MPRHQSESEPLGLELREKDARSAFHSKRISHRYSFKTSEKLTGHYRAGPLIHLPPEIDRLSPIHELCFSERQRKENPALGT